MKSHRPQLVTALSVPVASLQACPLMIQNITARDPAASCTKSRRHDQLAAKSRRHDQLNERCDSVPSPWQNATARTARCMAKQNQPGLPPYCQNERPGYRRRHIAK